MKTILKIAFIAFLLFLVITGNAKQHVQFEKALQSKMVQVTIQSNGGLELNLHFTNFLKDSIQIMIPAGWRFVSNDKKNDYQDVLVAHDKIILMKAKETKIFLLEGYCCEYTMLGPVKGITYSVGKQADSKLMKVAQFLNQNPTDRNTEQYSIWAISDNKETANITSKNDSLSIKLRHYVANIKGEPIPWYTLLKRTHVSTTGVVYDVPLEFKAKIDYISNKQDYSFLYIIDSKGKKVSSINGNWIYAKTNNYQADFDIKHLTKGNYSLVLESDKTVLMKKDFII